MVLERRARCRTALDVADIDEGDDLLLVAMA